FQNGIVNLLHAGASRSAQGSVEFMMREFLPLHNIGEDLAIVNQYLWATLNQLFQLFAFVGDAAYDAVHHDEGSGGNHSARDGVVPTVHCVLHRVTQDQQQDQVKGCQLADLSFPRDAQDDEQENVND